MAAPMRPASIGPLVRERPTLRNGRGFLERHACRLLDGAGARGGTRLAKPTEALLAQVAVDLIARAEQTIELAPIASIVPAMSPAPTIRTRGFSRPPIMRTKTACRRPWHSPSPSPKRHEVVPGPGTAREPASERIAAPSRS